MFSPRQRHIDYRIIKPDGSARHIPVILDERGVAVSPPATCPAAGAEFMGEDCAECERFHGACKAEIALGSVIDGFDDLRSTDTVRAEVRQEGRVVALEAPAPRVLASLMGLLMAASGCPRLIPFRAMALYHLPFATAEENAVRAAGFWLLRTHHSGSASAAEQPLADLQTAWDSLEEVNRHVSRKLLRRSANDAASNGIAFLDVLAKMGTMGLDSVLATLRPVFQARATRQAHATPDHTTA